MNTFVDQRLLQRLRAEYLEMPGMTLRFEQVQRLCGIQAPMCKALLDALVNVQFLQLNSDGTYVLFTGGADSRPRPRPAKAPRHSITTATTTRRAS
jgi:hypothetical protein